MKNSLVKNAVSILFGFILFWYAGAMLDFFPFIGDDFAVRAIGFTGLLLCAVVVVCTCWIINTIKKNK